MEENIEVKETKEVPKRKIRRRSLIIYYKQESALQALDESIRIVHKSNKYSNNYKELCNRLSNLRIQLENEELVKEYHKYESLINKYLDNLKKDMVKAVRGEI